MTLFMETECHENKNFKLIRFRFKKTKTPFYSIKLWFQLLACVIHFNTFLGKAGGSRPFQRSDGIEMVFGGARSTRFRRVCR